MPIALDETSDSTPCKSASAAAAAAFSYETCKVCVVRSNKIREAQARIRPYHLIFQLVLRKVTFQSTVSSKYLPTTPSSVNCTHWFFINHNRIYSIHSSLNIGNLRNTRNAFNLTRGKKKWSRNILWTLTFVWWSPLEKAFSNMVYLVHGIS